MRFIQEDNKKKLNLKYESRFPSIKNEQILDERDLPPLIEDHGVIWIALKTDVIETDFVPALK